MNSYDYILPLYTEQVLGCKFDQAQVELLTFENQRIKNQLRFDRLLGVIIISNNFWNGSQTIFSPKYHTIELTFILPFPTILSLLV